MPATTTVYCQPNDLLLGDMLTGTNDLIKWIENAANEIHAALGGVYVVPFVVATLPEHSVALLKLINARLASGWIILANAQGDTDRQEYGKYLIEEAKCELDKLRNGLIVLDGADTTESHAVSVPIAVPGDEVSGVESFYDMAMNPSWVPTFWKPGAAL